MNFARFIEALENEYAAAQEKKQAGIAPQPIKKAMTDEQRKKLDELRTKRSGSLEDSAPQGVSQGSISDFEETENIEFHDDGHSSGLGDITDPVPSAVGYTAPRFTTADARRGFVYSEILGKPLSMRRK